MKVGNQEMKFNKRILTIAGVGVGAVVLVTGTATAASQITAKQIAAF